MLSKLPLSCQLTLHQTEAVNRPYTNETPTFVSEEIDGVTVRRTQLVSDCIRVVRDEQILSDQIMLLGANLVHGRPTRPCIGLTALIFRYIVHVTRRVVGNGYSSHFAENATCTTSTHCVQTMRSKNMIVGLEQTRVSL